MNSMTKCFTGIEIWRITDSTFGVHTSYINVYAQRDVCSTSQSDTAIKLTVRRRKCGKRRAKGNQIKIRDRWREREIDRAACVWFETKKAF